MNTKVCKACGQEKPLSEFYVHKYSSDGKPVLHGKCKGCYNRYLQELLENNPERHAKKLEYKRQWNEENREKLAEVEKQRWAEYREKNPKEPKLTDEERKQHREGTVRRSSDKRKAAKQEATRKRKEAKARREEAEGRTCPRCEETKPVSEFRPRSRICKSCRNQAHIAYEKRREQKDSLFRERRRISHSRTQLKRRELLFGSHTAEEWLVLKESHGCCCAKCGAHESESPMTKDHIKPVTKGGTDNIDNIQPLCRRCNCRKSNKYEEK